MLTPSAALGRGEFFWHEVIGNRVVGTDGEELGTVRDLYRVGGTEVLVVAGGRHGEFDVPVVRSLIRVFAPRRGEIVVDAEALDLDAPLPPPDADAPRPRAPRRRTRRKAGAGSAAAVSPTDAVPADGASPQGDGMDLPAPDLGA